MTSQLVASSEASSSGPDPEPTATNPAFDSTTANKVPCGGKAEVTGGEGESSLDPPHASNRGTSASGKYCVIFDMCGRVHDRCQQCTPPANDLNAGALSRNSGTSARRDNLSAALQPTSASCENELLRSDTVARTACAVSIAVELNLHLYETNRGLPLDGNRARELYLEACTRGDGEGCHLLGELFRNQDPPDTCCRASISVEI